MLKHNLREIDGECVMSRRRGSMLLELTVAMIILGVLATLCVKWVAATSGQQRQMHWRQAALVEASNVMERLAAQKWEELSPERAAKISLSDDARQTLPDGSLAVQVSQPADDPKAKQIAVTVRWRQQTSTPDTQVRLIARRFR